MSACHWPDKIKHASEASAREHLAKLRNKDSALDVEVYRCGGHWHVGHSRKALNRRIRNSLIGRRNYRRSRRR